MCGKTVRVRVVYQSLHLGLLPYNEERGKENTITRVTIKLQPLYHDFAENIVIFTLIGAGMEGYFIN